MASATLAVATAFQPLRRRVQHAVDRRFNRPRYDVAQTIAAFTARLRGQLDLDTLTAELLGWWTTRCSRPESRCGYGPSPGVDEQVAVPSTNRLRNVKTPPR